MMYFDSEGKWNRGICLEVEEGTMESAGTWCRTLGPGELSVLLVSAPGLPDLL